MRFQIFCAAFLAGLLNSTSVFAIEDITAVAADNPVITASTPFSKPLANKLKGTYTCEVKGVLTIGSGAPLFSGGYTVITNVAPTGTNQYGTFSTTVPNILHINLAAPTSASASTCIYVLDTTKSKYVVNKLGIGLNDLHWTYIDSVVPEGCLAGFVDQNGFTMRDSAGKEVILSHINSSLESTFQAEQNVNCKRK